MRRREFLQLTVGATVAPVPAFAQPSGGLPIVGVVILLNEEVAKERAAALRAGLKEAGLVDDRDYTIALRFADGDPSRVPQIIKELAPLKPRVCVLAGFIPISINQLLPDTPIVFANITADPVASGLAQTWAKPGGMFTGNVMNALGGEESLTTKRIGYFKELVPKLTRLGMIGFATRNPSSERIALQKAGEHFGFALANYDLQTIGDVDGAITSGMRDDVSAFYISGDPRMNADIPRVAGAVAKSGRPTCGVYPYWADAGLLMTYSTDLNNGPYRAGFQVAKIIRGTKPGDLPIEQADKYVLAINLKTAKFVGVAVSPSLLALADKVIE